MPKTELMVLFKKIQRDDKKDVLKFEYRGKEDEERINVPQSIYEMVGEMVNIEIEGTKCGPITAEFLKSNKDSKKVVLDLALKGDSEEKAIELFKKGGHNVKLTIEPSQSSLLDEEKEQKDPHEGIEYSVDLSGNVVDINKKNTEEKKEPVAVAATGTDADVLI